MGNIIEVKNLVKDFKHLRAVDNISFDVAEGSVFAFLGPNGAGKSTTIKMLTTLLRPTSGKIKLAGYDPVKDADKARHNFGIVFQDPSSDDELTAYENLEFHAVLYGLSKKLRRERMEQLLNIVSLWDRRDDLVKTFSGGMKRRLEIARGLLHHPKILFLDEPTLGLDPQTRNHIWDYIFEINKKENVTVFFTTHYMEEADRAAGHVVIIDQGKIIAQGSPEDLKKSTETGNLEDAFIKLTGAELRQEQGSRLDNFRARMRARHG